MKHLLTIWIIGLMLSSSAFAGSYELTINKIRCNKCVQKIHDYFSKTYGPRIQNLKIDPDTSKVTFESISIDTVEMENIKKGLSMLGFTVDQPASAAVEKPDSM